ncbi:hypothetical protein CLOM_g8049 [Closterium sp. NIES-68]|nr:hypothetical protein CLOM_g8049 [Closterium sp. NIES-68]GJP65042.1 hypothetical protein CLOP_g21959 [Closterium sp. NIES-67]
MGGLSHSSILSCLLLAVLLPCLSEAAVVRLQRIKIFQTHDLPFWKPSVYFQCEGEPKRQLDVVVEANVDYNFTMHEPFQPLTELTAPKCKQCGFYDADTLTEDDAFDRFTLCPLDFTPAPSGRLNRLVESELNVTFVCLHCNPDRTSRSSGDEFEGTDTNNVSLLYVFLLVIGVVTGITCLTGLVAFWLKSGAWPLFRRRMDSDTAKFMEMFDEEDELLDGDDGSGEDMEMGEAGGTASSSPPSMTSASNRHGSAIRHD